MINKLKKLRQLLVPPGSSREAFYVRFLRPKAVLLCIRMKVALIGFKKTTVSVTHSQRYRAEDVKNVLIVKADHIGDFIMALQAFKILRQGFPNASFTLLCGPWNKEFAEGTCLFDRIIYINVFQGSGKVSDPIPFDPTPILNADLPQFDVAIDLKVERETRFLLNYIKAYFKAGFDAQVLPRDMSFVLPIPGMTIHGHPNEARHTRTLLSMLASGVVNAFESQKATIEQLNNIATSLSLTTTQLPKLPRKSGPTIGINVGSTASTRNWPLKYYIELIKKLIAEKDVTIVLFGGKQQQLENEQILAEISRHDDIILDLAGKVTLLQFEVLLKGIDLYIGHDTGSTHLSASLGRPTLCLYSGTTPYESYGPLGDKVTIIKVHHLPCSPCGLKDVDMCKFQHRCMRSITVDDVMKEIMRIVELA